MQSQQLYDKYVEGRHWEKHPTVYAERFVDFLKKKKNSGMIIDVGCGNGRDVEIFADAGFKTLGIDYAKEEIAKTQQKFPQLKFEVMNVEKLKFQDNSIDAFFMINVIHYVNKEKALQEIFRTLKQKRYFFIHVKMRLADRRSKTGGMFASLTASPF